MKIIIVFIFFVSLSISLNAQESQKKDDIRKLITLIGSAKVGIEIADRMIDVFKQSYPDAKDDFWDEFRKKIKEEDLINLVIPIYDKYFSHDDIIGLIEFYKTPVGQKYIQVLPIISQESMAAGQEWGTQLSNKVIEQLKKKD